MKRIVLGIVALSFMVTSVFAWSIQETKKSGSQQLDHYVSCDQGYVNIIIVGENTYTNKYFVGGKMYGSMSQAVNSNCSKKTKLYRLKQEAMVCKSKSRIRELLAGDGTTYNLHKINLRYGDKGDCFLVSSSSKVQILKQYRNETFVKTYDNGKKQWKETVKLCDTYYRIEAKGGKYYVRKNDINW